MGTDPGKVNKIKGLEEVGPSGTTRNAECAEVTSGLCVLCDLCGFKNLQKLFSNSLISIARIFDTICGDKGRKSESP